MLDITDQKVKYSLYITKTSNPIVFSTSYIVKIYDFDHATIVETKYRKGTTENTLLEEEEMCYTVGECNTMNPGRDYAQFCWWINAHAKDLLPQMVKQTIDASVDNVFLRNKAFDQGGSLSWSGHPCIKTENRCQPYSTNSVVKMISDISKSNTLQDRGSTDHGSASALYLPSYSIES